jgi:hypothetical protein
MSRNLLRNQVSSTLRTQTRGVAGETVAVGAAILGAGKLIGGGLAAAGLIGAGTGIGTVFGALITGKHNGGARSFYSGPSHGPIFMRTRHRGGWLARILARYT